MKITYVKTDDNVIKEYENNPRINNKAIDAVAHSIEKYGFKQPIVLSKDGTIVVGHTRYLAAKQLELDKVPVIYSDLTEEQERAYRIADNKTNQFSAWDYMLLEEEFNELNLLNYEPSDLGFTKMELENMFLEKNIDNDFEEISETLKTKNKCPSCGFEYD